VTTSLLTAIQVHSLSMRTGFPTGTSLPVAPSGRQPLALSPYASSTSCFLLASGLCPPLALQGCIYALSSHCQSLHPEDGRQHGPLNCWYHNTTLHSITTQKNSNLHHHETSNLASINILFYLFLLFSLLYSLTPSSITTHSPHFLLFPLLVPVTVLRPNHYLQFIY